MKTVYYGIEVLNMTIDSENLLNSIIETFGRMTYISPDEIPDIDLYMDQVTTFMDDRLKPSTRNKSEEKLMTKTMINNYAKNDVIPPPIKKKYNKEHVLILILLYYFKSILQINDIKDLLDPIIAKFFDSGSNYGIEEIYKKCCSRNIFKINDIMTIINSTQPNITSNELASYEQDKNRFLGKN